MNGSDVGKNIKKLREQKKMTQSELADNIGVSFQAVSAWERGTCLPDLHNASLLAKALSVSLDALAAREDDEYFIGVDAGGTKTEFMTVSKTGKLADRFVLGGANPNDVSLAHTLEVLCAGLDREFSDRRVVSVFCGIAGVTAGDYAARIREELEKKYRVRVSVESDVSNLLYLGGLDGYRGAVICGTGSVVFVRTDGGDRRIGGWGYLFDEKGSAYDVGKDAIIHSLEAQDGLRTEDALSRRMTEVLGGSDAFSSLSHVYSKGRSYIASLAPEVVRLAEAGDEASLDILRKNAERLSLLIKTASGKYPEADSFIASGGFLRNDIYLDMIEKTSGKKLMRSVRPPVFGACVGAFIKAGIEVPEQLRQTARI